MAAKITAVILLMVCASAYSETVGRRFWPKERCTSQLEENMPLVQCEKWARSGWPEIRLPSGEEEERNEECCEELGQLSEGCRCHAVHEMMSEMDDLPARRMACSLTIRCGMNPCNCPR